MKSITSIKIILLLATFFCMNATSALAQDEMKAGEKHLAYLKKFRSGYVTTMLEGKAERIAGYYDDNVRLMPEFQKTVLTKSNALLYHHAFLSRFEIKEYSRTEIEILDLGAQVAELGIFTMKMKLKSTGKEHELNGKYQNIWKKLEHDQLTLITEAWNYDHPTEIVEQLKFDEVPAIQMAYQPHVPINNNISFELAALCSLLETTITQHDARIWSQFYSDDATIAFSYNPIYQGRRAVDGFLEKHVSQMPVFEKLDVRNDHIDNLGEYIIEYASHIANWRNGESSGVNTGKNIRIWRRGADGSLKIFRQIGMYD